jgi:hypothetical protein
MKSLKETIMRRDELTSEEADAMIEEAKAQVLEGEDPEEVLMNDFGLEPDYVFDLLD